MKILTIGFLILVISGQLNANDHSAANTKITLNLDGASEVLVKGFIAPIEYTQFGFHVEWDELANLRVAEPNKHYPASVFRAFLPPEVVSVGELWKIEEEGVLELLRQLHPKPNLDISINSGDSYGLWACLRAYNDKYADIVFRIHAEFILRDGRFTPSQFTGHLVIDRIKEKVTSFKMSVPEGVLNFDVGRNSTNTIDVGFCPRMELRAETQEIVSDIEFIESITQEAAERKLILRFYKSQQINWVSLEEALEMAPAQQKPVHVLSIMGPLADESC
ncbi:hypothetical protein C6500_08700 [Candidatus Poribacteria bacterium]|nr:MAG: hypothetical protein C6500_08700 [Candidatus Poribacteria bacterium]